MLLQFAVENVLSFRDRAVLSMLAVDGVEHSEEQIVRLPGLKTPVLKVAAVYGANASGKSNLLKALQFLRDLIAMGVRPGQRSPNMAFLLDAESARASSRFEVELFVEGALWSYGIEVRPERVDSEWLYRKEGRGKEKMVFERTAGKTGNPEIRLGTGLKLNTQRKQFFHFLAEGTRHVQPFLADCAERNLVELAPVLGWFSKRFGVVRAAADVPSIEGLLFFESARRQFVESMLMSADTGVGRLGISLHPGNSPTALSEMQKILGNSGVEAASAFVFDQMQRQGILAELSFVMLGAPHAALQASEQSDGTLRLMNLSAILYDVIGPTGVDLLAIDELDRSLHTLLARQLVQRFLAQTAGRPAQLLFTTHDTNLLDLHLLPRDSVWFTEKDRSGGSTLYSLAEFKPEQLDALGANLEEGYLQGRFGAIPFLTDPRRTGWSSEG